MKLIAISWNLFHGRDFPPDPALFTWRSRLLRVTERNLTHVQVNRELVGEFSRLLAGADWDVALLQECPPRYWAPLAAACGAEPHGVLTSRNSLGAMRSLAARLNPDLIASGEGGSNLTLVRSSFRGAPRPPDQEAHRSSDDWRGNGGIVERREAVIHEGRPERRAMAFTRVRADDSDLCIANLHATNDRPELAAEDVLRAAGAATAWAGEAPLIFGGDLNLRPASDPAIFAELEARFGLTGTTTPDAIDHLLARGLGVESAPTQWPPGRRELREGRRALRLSDHAPVAAAFSIAPGSIPKRPG